LLLLLIVVHCCLLLAVLFVLGDNSVSPGEKRAIAETGDLTKEKEGVAESLDNRILLLNPGPLLGSAS
jgi:hypothetical protein